jgi:hypothetical protein
MTASYITKRGAVWYFKRRVGGRVVFQSLRTGDRQLAARKAKLLAADLEAGRWDRVFELRTRRELATLGEVFTCYLASTDLQIAPHTMRENVNCVRRMVRVGHAVSEVDALPVSVLSPGLVRQYQQSRLLACAGGDERGRDGVAVSCNSTHAQARSLFSKRAMRRDIYADLSLGEGVRRFCEAEPLSVLPRDNYLAPNGEVVARLWAAQTALRVESPGVWLAFWLAAMTGLRRGEIVAARWRWLSSTQMSVPVEDDFVPKSGRARVVPVIADVEREARAAAVTAGFDTSPEAHILPGSAAARFNLFRSLGLWMKANGWTRRQKAHELRKVFASALCAMSSPYAAQMALGHSELETTSRYAARPLVAGVDPRPA